MFPLRWLPGQNANFKVKLKRLLIDRAILWGIILVVWGFPHSPQVICFRVELRGSLTRLAVSARRL